MKRANLYRRWTEARVARELVKATRRAALLAEEVNRREREREKAELRLADSAKGKAKDRETAFRLAHLAGGADAS